MRLLLNGLMILGIAFLLLCVLILRPVPHPDRLDKCLSVTGKVYGISEAGVKDVVFSLEGTNRRFYINRGLEDGLRLDSLRTRLQGREVTLYYPRYWTPLDPRNRIRHLAQVNLGEQVVWTEIR